MRQGTLRFATATGLVLALGMAACGGDDGESADGATTTTEAEDETTTTTEAEEEETTTTGADATTTTVDEVDVAWRANAVEFREDPNGTEHDYECPPDGVEDTVWGTDVYTDDSSVCNAAVHAGLISLDEGGTVTIVIEGPQDAYTGSEQNGVTSSDYPAWPGSFSFA